jgi:hypothetical protein
MTNIQRLTITLTLFNLILLAFGLAQLRPAVAQGVAPVLRARALEIVDDQGRVRAEIKVLPKQPTIKMGDETGFGAYGERDPPQYCRGGMIPSSDRYQGRSGTHDHTVNLRNHASAARRSRIAARSLQRRKGKQNGLLSTDYFRRDLSVWHLGVGERAVTVRCGFAEH